MITLLFGENDYELTKKVAQLKADFDGTAERFDAAELSNEQLADIFAGQTLFASKRLIFIDSPSANPDLWKNLEAWSERLNADTQLVLVEPKPDKRTTVFKWLKKHANVQEFMPFTERDQRAVSKWLESYAHERDITLTSHQLQRLVERGGTNQWELAHAVDKLSLAGEVTDQWIDDVTQATPSENAFALFETVINGDVRRISAMLEQLRLTEEPYRLLGLMNTQALQLAVLTYGEADVSRVAADTAAKSSYPYQKLAPYARRLSKSQVKEIVELLAASDMRLKSSDATPWLVLERTLAGMASILNR
ncbi:MAG: polymerase subunit delta [Patescibacteria group bacterium]|nr:polymerase subunit delta [Patescibacteria group bacterium]